MDNYCDANWVAQQQALARQHNDMQLLNTLLLYHMMWSTTPYNVGSTFIYTPNTYWRSRPSGYSIMPRSAYYNNVVVNHTIVVQGGRAVATRPLAANSFAYRNPSSTTTRSTTTTTTTAPRPSSTYQSSRTSSTTRSTTTTTRSYSSSSSSRRR